LFSFSYPLGPSGIKESHFICLVGISAPRTSFSPPPPSLPRLLSPRRAVSLLMLPCVFGVCVRGSRNMILFCWRYPASSYFRKVKLSYTRLILKRRWLIPWVISTLQSSFRFRLAGFFPHLVIHRDFQNTTLRLRMEACRLNSSVRSDAAFLPQADSRIE